VGYRAGIAAYYAAFDALLLTSENEGTPVVAIEALAAGRPVVATDVGGVATVVDDGETGLLAARADVEGLADRVERLARDPALRREMGALGVTRMRERFASERMVGDVQRLYERLV
jgi:glycosyltransferase involved in cell wall biosynthesis